MFFILQTLFQLSSEINYCFMEVWLKGDCTTLTILGLYSGLIRR